MGNIPVVDEVLTSVQSLGDALVGDMEGACKRWEDYSESSVFGSGVKSAAYAISGDLENANRLGKAMGRATGSMILGGGLLRSFPVFHELATCGDSLGDMIGGGDNEAACQRWAEYSEKSVFGSGLRALVALANDDKKEAVRLGKATGEAAANGVVTAATIGAAVAGIGLTVITGRAFIHADGVVSPTPCRLHETYCDAVGNIAENSIQDQKVKPAGDATAAVTVTRDATAVVTVTGDATAVVNVAGDGTAVVTVAGDATAVVTVTGDGTAVVTVTGDGIAAITVTGNATAAVTVTGDATAAVTVAEDATTPVTVTEDATAAVTVTEDATAVVTGDVAGSEAWVILEEDTPETTYE